MGEQFKVGERYYFPLHGVGEVKGIDVDTLKVSFRGIIAFLDFFGRPVRYG